MSLINLDLVFNAITSIAKPLIKEKILRSETVIKLLQQFHLDPEHPPADFSGVYAYALLEYGVGKPKPLLELFRQKAIKQAFRTALDHNNPSILLSEVDAFLDTYTLGDDISSLELDVRREVAEFATVFIEVAKRTRTPSDVLLNQKIGSLHKRIACIQEQLERLPTLEGIRTEIARLAVENYPALPGIATENQCRAIALTQQMRGWFETLGYTLEKYEIWAEEYFEWIINIPVRRSYDRILIRGVAGEVGLSDVMALRSSIEAQKTDEGWLVTTRRISRAARDEVKKEQLEKNIFVNGNELLRRLLQGYLDLRSFDEALHRDPNKQKYWVVLVDGNKTQLNLLKKFSRQHHINLTIVLDIIHVIEYLWKAAFVFYDNTSKSAESWVSQRLLSILQGKSSLVASGMRRSATLQQLSSQERLNVDKCANYLLNNKAYLKYDCYLNAGFPIATGVIEGACRHLVKDRMDITGARWSLRGAEAVLRKR